MMLRSQRKRDNQPPKQNNVLKKLRKKVFIQGAIALQTLIIAVALIFGMSAAWYNNVLQTSGLQFQAEAWGFSGHVSVINPSDLVIAPGEDGIIGIVIENSNDEMLDATVRVTKDQMPEEMRKRMFFYVDTPTNRNGEMLDRVYVNAVSGYTYTVLDGTSLVITEDRKNDAPLQWQWVYDMLGYYFLGTVAEEAVTVQEYLRPVEYDLDRATFDADGQLKTVDGVTAVADFLQNLAATDGYAGEITAVAEMPGYYQVAVDEDGYGVWIYLCNWEDIQEATAYDTNLGLQAAKGEQQSFPAMVTLVGQPTQITYTQVATTEELEAALENGEMVQLSQDVILTEALSIQSQGNMMLDLNGHTIQAPANDAALKLSEGANLTVHNGALAASGAGADVVIVNASHLTLSKVEIQADGRDGILLDDLNSTADSCVRLFDCTIDAKRCAAFVRGNGTDRDGYSQLIIENSVLTSDYITICGNGNRPSWGTEIQVYRSTVEGYYAAVYQPQGESTTVIRESRMTGITGIAIKGGDLVLENSKVYGIGTPEQIVEPSYAVSGFQDTGDAVYVEDGYGLPIRVTISGADTLLSSANAQAFQVFEFGSVYVDVMITGGSFNTDVSSYLTEGFEYVNGTVRAKEDG